MAGGGAARGDEVVGVKAGKFTVLDLKFSEYMLIE